MEDSDQVAKDNMRAAGVIAGAVLGAGVKATAAVAKTVSSKRKAKKPRRRRHR